jgi:hypothetical protein
MRGACGQQNLNDDKHPVSQHPLPPKTTRSYRMHFLNSVFDASDVIFRLIWLPGFANATPRQQKTIENSF